ncbi:MAG: hypothetical protein J7K53_05960 [Bacteroidales bacterium]|nr:hypothetical protein [Bacteroidales bacterium]
MKRQKQIPESYWIPLLAVAFTILYLVFPTNNSSVDAYYYAASVKYSGELFHPHHLLYNATFRLFFNLPFINNEDINILQGMKMANSFIGGICLCLFSLLLKRTGRSVKEIFGIILLTGSSFIVMRYSSENEVYLFPLALSLGASVIYQDYLNKRSLLKLLISGLLVSIAVLYHQISVFWWLGLFIGLIFFRHPWKSKLVFVTTAIPVILVYSIVVFQLPGFENNFTGIFKFALRDYLSSGFDKIPGWENLFFTPVNLIRSFIQIHGYIFRMIGENILWIIPGMVSMLLAGTVFIRKGFSIRKTELLDRPFFITHLLILILYIVFAFIAEGNAEFMVMIPFLGFLLLFAKIKIKDRSMILLASALLVWNISYGLIPRNNFKFTHNTMLESWIKKNPDATFVIKSDQQVISRLYYQSGVEVYPQIIKSPSSLTRRGISITGLYSKLDTLIARGNQIYTDCVGYPGILSRQGVIDTGEDDYFFSGYEYEPVDSVETLFGTFFLHRIGDQERH